MSQPTQPSTRDEGARAALIEEAAGATGVLPTHERLDELNQQLRVEIEKLMPIVRGQANALNHGTTGWYNRDRALAAARNTLGEDMGVGLRSAALHVKELGQRLQELDGYTATASSGPRPHGR